MLAGFFVELSGHDSSGEWSYWVRMARIQSEIIMHKNNELHGQNTRYKVRKIFKVRREWKIT
jgi:hypothetical protein